MLPIKVEKIPKSMPESFIDIVEYIVLDYFNINKTEFRYFVKLRKREFVNARQMIMYFAYNYTDLSLSKIGARYQKDHATVLHAVKVVNNLRETDKNFNKNFLEIHHLVHQATEKGSQEVFVCFRCGGIGVTTKLDVDPNSKIIYDTIDSGTAGFCRRCGETTIVTEYDFKEYYYEDHVEAISGPMQRENKGKV